MWISLLLALSRHQVEAQGTLTFTTSLVGTNTDATGRGTFSLSDSSLAYELITHVGFPFAEIRGPGSDPNAPVLFELDWITCIAPGPYIDARCEFRGDFALTAAQIDQLVAGQWYVYSFPDPSVRSLTIAGQVVPEPTTQAVLLLCLLLTGCGSAWRAARKGTCPTSLR